MKDNQNECLPIVNDEGTVIGKATRGECHGGSLLLHPVVHLHVYNLQGHLFLQHRPKWKDVQPDKWDTAVGGHIDYGENVAEALRREAREELGIDSFEENFLLRYKFCSEIEHELVHVFKTTIDFQPRPSAELDGGRFFSREEIEELIGQSFFTPNFEGEWQKIKDL